jgi:hypothetical protein
VCCRQNERHKKKSSSSSHKIRRHQAAIQLSQNETIANARTAYSFSHVKNQGEVSYAHGSSSRHYDTFLQIQPPLYLLHRNRADVFSPDHDRAAATYSSPGRRTLQHGSAATGMPQPRWLDGAPQHNMLIFVRD